jgi:hypothetical protein
MLLFLKNGYKVTELTVCFFELGTGKSIFVNFPLDIPIVGIGGIDFDNQQQAFDAGCSAVAMIAALVDR